MAIPFTYFESPDSLSKLPFSKFRMDPETKRTDFHFFKVTPDLWQCNDRQPVIDPKHAWETHFQGIGSSPAEAYENCLKERNNYVEKSMLFFYPTKLLPGRHITH